MTNFEKLIAAGPSVLLDELGLFNCADFPRCPRDTWPEPICEDAYEEGRCRKCWLEWLEKEVETDE